jgi:hypothetical protein
MLFQLPRESFHPQDTSRRSPFAYREIGSRDIARLVTLSSCNQTPKPDPRWSTVNAPVGDFPIGKSAMKEVLDLRLSKPRMPMCDATCCTPLSLRGTRRNSGLRGFSVLPSTLKTPKCRVPTPRDLVPPVPPMIDGSD